MYNKNMHKRERKGFTIIEVSLFLALTGFMFVGLAVGTSANIARQRYNNAVQDFAEFLRSVYSSVINVENDATSIGTGMRDNLGNHLTACSLSGQVGNNGLGFYGDTSTDIKAGRTECAIYGKLVTFGEVANDTTARVYTVVGDASDSGINNRVSTDLAALAEVKADIIIAKQVASGTCNYGYAGNFTTYSPTWNARIEDVANTKPLKVGAILIFRSPLSGIIQTYVLKNNSSNQPRTIKASALIGGSNFGCNTVAAKRSTALSSGQLLSSYFTGNNWETANWQKADVEFCLGSEDLFAVSKRRNIRLLADARNASAVSLVSQDLTGTGGNRCDN